MTKEELDLKVEKMRASIERVNKLIQELKEGKTVTNNVIHADFTKGREKEPTLIEDLYKIQVANEKRREENAKKIKEANNAIIAKYRKSSTGGSNNNK